MGTVTHSYCPVTGWAQTYSWNRANKAYVVTVTVQPVEHLGLCGSSNWIVCKTNRCLFLFSFKLRLLRGLHPALSYLQIILDTSPRAKWWRECSACLLFLEEQQKLLLLFCMSTLRWTIAIFCFFFLFFFFASDVHKLHQKYFHVLHQKKSQKLKRKDNLVLDVCHLYFKYSSRRCVLLKQCFCFEW